MNFLIEIISLSIMLIATGSMGLFVLRLMHQHQMYSVISMRLVLLVFFAVLGLHSTLSLWNGFAGPIFGADRDAYVFHLSALSHVDIITPSDWGDIADINLDRVGWYYALFLKGLYALTTESWAIGGMLSTLAFAYLCVVCTRIYFLLNPTAKNHTYALCTMIACVGLLPAVLLLTSFTLREVFQMLFLATAVMYALKFYMIKRIIHLMGVALSLGLFSALHHSFLPYSMLFVLSMVVYLQVPIILEVFKKFKTQYVVGIMAIVILFLILLIGQIYNADFKNFLKNATSLFYVNTARAFYGSVDYSDHAWAILVYVCVSVFNYFVRPWPWEIDSLIDVVTLVENVIRLYVWLTLWRTRRYLSQPITWLLCCLALLEVLWALGTMNWGTAQRHHIVVWPLLVVAWLATMSRSKQRLVAA